MVALDKRKVSLLTLLDLSAAFDTIDHSLLIQRLRHDFGIYGTALDWFRSYLSNRSQSVLVDGHISEPTEITCGVPQGSVLGPILFVLYTTPLSTVIKSHSVIDHSYADDSQLQKSASPRDIPYLIQSMQECISDVKSWMTVNKLKLNDDKTEVMLVSSKQMSHKLTVPDSMIVGDATISFTRAVKNLGVTLDNHLEMEDHVYATIRASNFQLRRIASIRQYITADAAATLVSAYILSRLDYCNSLLYNCHNYLTDKLQIVMNNAARLVLRIPRRAHITPHLVSLHWLPVQYRIRYKIAYLSFQCKQGLSPDYLKKMVPDKERSRSDTRSSSDTVALREGPAHSQKTLGDKCFSRAAPVVWNSLPLRTRTSETRSSFKSALKTYMFDQAY